MSLLLVRYIWTSNINVPQVADQLSPWEIFPCTAEDYYTLLADLWSDIELANLTGGWSYTGTVTQLPLNQSFSWASADDFINSFFWSTSPVVTLSTSASVWIREIGVEVVNPTLSITTQLGSNPSSIITQVEFFRDWVSISSQVSSPTTYQDIYTFSSNTSYSVSVTDWESRTDTDSVSFQFVYPIFEGLVSSSSDISEGMTRAAINALPVNLVVVGEQNRSVTTSPSSQRFAFIYPQSYGNLSSIIDDNWFETISDYDVIDFNLSDMLDGSTVAYRAYVLKWSTTQISFTNQYRF